MEQQVIAILTDNRKEIEAVEALIEQLTVKAKRPKRHARKTHIARKRALETLEEIKQDFVNAQFNFAPSNERKQNNATHNTIQKN
jgi:hypothetical protein